MTHLPASVAALFDHGVRLMQEGDAAGAEAAFRATLLLSPDTAAHVNLGWLLAQRGCATEAEQHYRAALALDPHLLQACLNCGAMLAAQKRFTEAESLYRQALSFHPASTGALSNLGVLLACTQRECEAEACYRAALAIAPDHRNASFNLAYLLLRQGRFADGWDAFEARDWYARLEQHFAYPRWHGEPLAGKALMIGFEAGHGDMIQFCRYASLARAQGAARIAIVCHPGLTALFTRLAGVDAVFGFDGEVPRTGYDYWTPPLSLPRLFQTRLDTIPGQLPYLFADPGKASASAPLTAGPGLRVGLAWQGNPRFENDADRSLASLDLLAPLFKVPGVTFFSLQKDATAAHANGLPLTDLAPHIADFDDTAALIAQLDLVISVDTAVAHLAGALGKPVWVLLPAFKTDWRWLTDRTDTPWYPGVMHLFRQQQAGDWTGAVAALTSALRDTVTARGQPTA